VDCRSSCRRKKPPAHPHGCARGVVRTREAISRILSRALLPSPGAAHSSGGMVAHSLDAALRDRAGRAVALSEETPPVSRLAPRWGLPCHPCRQGCGALLPPRFALAATVAWRTMTTAGRWFVFCGTFLRVTPTGRSPAPMPCGARTFLPFFRRAGCCFLLRTRDRYQLVLRSATVSHACRAICEPSHSTPASETMAGRRCGPTSSSAANSPPSNAPTSRT
jgi:hypothetical protein